MSATCTTSTSSPLSTSPGDSGGHLTSRRTRSPESDPRNDGPLGRATTKGLRRSYKRKVFCFVVAFFLLTVLSIAVTLLVYYEFKSMIVQENATELYTTSIQHPRSRKSTTVATTRTTLRHETDNMTEHTNEMLSSQTTELHH